MRLQGVDEPFSASLAGVDKQDGYLGAVIVEKPSQDPLRKHKGSRRKTERPVPDPEHKGRGRRRRSHKKSSRKKKSRRNRQK
jgi:hypothetical protein